MALVLPCLAAELDTPALPRIVDELKELRYLEEVMVALGRASEEQFFAARDFFSQLSQRTTVLWIESSRTQVLLRGMERELSVGQDGKGHSGWLCYGYLLARGQCDVIALHDCDILSHRRDLLARLVYPVANPRLGFDFCKGYYSRVTERLHGPGHPAPRHPAHPCAGALRGEGSALPCLHGLLPLFARRGVRHGRGSRARESHPRRLRPRGGHTRRDLPQRGAGTGVPGGVPDAFDRLVTAVEKDNG